MEQPGQRQPGRSSQATKVSPLSQSRPMSADDIQKAKLRAMYMQGKYGKASPSSTGKKEMKTEDLGKSATNKSSISPQVASRPITEELKTLPQSTSTRLEAPTAPLQKIDLKESPSEKCTRPQICWHVPPGTLTLNMFLLVSLSFCEYYIILERIALGSTGKRSYLAVL